MSQIIPADRQVDWTLAGIPGGIPHRTNIFVNVLTTTNTNYKCAGDGVSDDSMKIYNALRACPSNQVVYMPAANYCFSNRVYIASYSGVTLRGDGMGKTVIVSSVSSGVFMLGSLVGYGNGGSHYLGTNTIFSLGSGYTKGSSNITVSAATQGTVTLLPGQLIQISQSNDWFVTSIGQNGQQTFSSITGDGQHCLNQLSQIVSITGGTNLTIWPPLGWGYTNSLSPVLFLQDFSSLGVPNVCRQDGFENFTITNSIGAASQQHVFDVICAVQCWLSNVEIVNHKNYGGLFYNDLQCQIDSCWIHATSTNSIYYQMYGFETKGSTFCLFQNNIFDGFFEALQIGSGGCGNVVAFNLFTNYFNAAATGGDKGRLAPGLSVSHGAYPMMNLIEGNVGMGMQADFYWGSSGYDTIFRNNFTSVDTKWSGYPLTDIIALKIDAGSWWNNIVGNVLGSPSVRYSAHQMGGQQGYEYPVINRFGYPGIDSNGFTGTNSGTGSFDTNVLATMILTGNYDYYHKSVIWDTNGVQTMPASLLYPNGAPSWWGTNRWPAIDPLGSPLVVAIPAQLRYGGAITNPSASVVAPPFNLLFPSFNGFRSPK